MIARDVMGVDLEHVTANGIARNDAFTTTCLIELLSEIQKSMLAHSYSTSSSLPSHRGGSSASAVGSSSEPGSQHDHTGAAFTNPNRNEVAGAIVDEALWTDEPQGGAAAANTNRYEYNYSGNNADHNNPLVHAGNVGLDGRSGSSSEDGVAYYDEKPRSEIALEAALDLLEINRYLPDANRLHPVMHRDLGRQPHPLLDSATTATAESNSSTNNGGDNGGDNGSDNGSETEDSDGVEGGGRRPDLQAHHDLSYEIQALINRYTNDVNGVHNDGETTTSSESDLEELLACESAAAGRVHVGGGALIGSGYPARTSAHAVDGRVSAPTVELLDAHNRAWEEKAQQSPDPTVRFFDGQPRRPQQQQGATGVNSKEFNSTAAATTAAATVGAPRLQTFNRLDGTEEQGPRSDTSLSHPDSLGGGDGIGTVGTKDTGAGIVNTDLARSHPSRGINQRREGILKAVLRGTTATATADAAVAPSVGLSAAVTPHPYHRGAGGISGGDDSGLSRKEKQKKRTKKGAGASVAGGYRGDKPWNQKKTKTKKSSNNRISLTNASRGRRPHPSPAGAHVAPPRIKSRNEVRTACGIKHPGPRAGVAVPNIEAVLPGLPVAQHVKRHLWSTHMKRAEAALRNTAADAKRPPPAPALLAEEMERRQVGRIARANEDAVRKKRVEAALASKERALKVRRAVYEQRRSSMQLTQFYQQYHRKQQAQQIRRRTGEELAVRRLFNQYTKEAMDRTREAEKYAKEMQATEDRRRKDEILSCARWFEDQVELFEASRINAQTDTKALERAKEREFEKLKADMQQSVQDVQKNLLLEFDYSAKARLLDVDFNIDFNRI